MVTVYFKDAYLSVPITAAHWHLQCSKGIHKSTEANLGFDPIEGSVLLAFCGICFDWKLMLYSCRHWFFLLLYQAGVPLDKKISDHVYHSHTNESCWRYLSLALG